MRVRRQFTEEFKLEAVRLALAEDRSIAQVARALGVRADLLRKWKQQVLQAREARPDHALPTTKGDVFPGAGHLTSTDEELRRLRREVAVLREERDILKRATAFFAKESR
jgi:transposase